ncbi:hypothetical protein V492_02028, partial [Pseudogymnoascus sp. VKM F-4246]
MWELGGGLAGFSGGVSSYGSVSKLLPVLIWCDDVMMMRMRLLTKEQALARCCGRGRAVRCWLWAFEVVGGRKVGIEAWISGGGRVGASVYIRSYLGDYASGTARAVVDRTRDTRPTTKPKAKPHESRQYTDRKHTPDWLQLTAGQGADYNPPTNLALSSAVHTGMRTSIMTLLPRVAWGGLSPATTSRQCGPSPVATRFGVDVEEAVQARRLFRNTMGDEDGSLSLPSHGWGDPAGVWGQADPTLESACLWGCGGDDLPATEDLVCLLGMDDEGPRSLAWLHGSSDPR